MQTQQQYYAAYNPDTQAGSHFSSSPTSVEMYMLLRNHSAADTTTQHVIEEAIQMQALPREWFAPAFPESRCQCIQHRRCKIPRKLD